MQPAPRRALSLFALAALGVPACKHAATGPSVAANGLQNPSAATTQGLLATLLIPSLDRTITRIDTLAAHSRLPFRGQDLLTTLIAAAHLPVEARSAIDTAQPIAVVLYTPATKVNAQAVFALTVRDARSATNLAKALGTPGVEKDGLQQLNLSDGGTLWLGHRDRIVVGSRSREALVAAGASAVRATTTVSGDEIVLTAFTDALARWQGSDARTAMATFRDQILDEQRKTGANLPLVGALAAAMLDGLLSPLADTTTGGAAITLDPAHGIDLTFRLQPRPGTAFAADVATRTPYDLAPALSAGATPAAIVAAIGPTPFPARLFGTLLAAWAQAGSKPALDASNLLRSWWLPTFTGAATSRITPTSGRTDSDGTLALRPGVAPTAVLDGLVAFCRLTTSLVRDLDARNTPTTIATRQGDFVRIETTYPKATGPNDPNAVVKALMGSSQIVTLATVSRGQLVFASEPGARARIAAFATTTAGTPAPELATAQRDTKGSEGVFYMDMMALARPVLAAAGTPDAQAQMFGMLLSLPGLAQLKLPLVFSYEGGDDLKARFRVPLSTLSSAGSVMHLLGGMGTLGAALSPSTK